MTSSSSADASPTADNGSVRVKKRDGRSQNFLIDKLHGRIRSQSYRLSPVVSPFMVAMRVRNGILSAITTDQLDELAAEVAASLTTVHPDYAILAARLAVTSLEKRLSRGPEKRAPRFSEVIQNLHADGQVCDDCLNVVMNNADRLDDAIINHRDREYTYFGFKTLECSYLLRIDGLVIERPQQMLMRVAVGIHGEDINAAIETYNLMSERWFTHATSTLFNAGTCRPQLSSCFLLSMSKDSMRAVGDTLSNCGMISQSAGGIGIALHSARAKESSLDGGAGKSSGLVPLVRLFNNMTRYANQGGKRPGAFAIYLEPWHADIMDFLELKKNTGVEEERARDLFYALWIPDLFMRRVEADEMWSLMCPHECPGLPDCWGPEFDALYHQYEAEERYRRRVPARQVWKSIISSQIETGTPYMLYKDACNAKSNQKNLGTIKCSNLCTEIVEYSSPDEVAVCNLASVALGRFVVQPKTDDTEGKPYFDFKKLKYVTKIVTRNLNKIIDINYYPIPEAKLSNMRHRPIGIGVQGLADAFCLMRYPFVSDEAKLLNQQIFETMYHAALEASCELAERDGSYTTYEGSPASQGQLQYDLWGATPTSLWNWATLKERIAKHGLRNSLLLAPMPTASTAQILGNNESIEPYTSNVYSRRVLSGDFQIVNPHLLKDLVDAGMWNEDLRNRLIADGGSVQRIDGIPAHVKELYKTVWEIPQKDILQMAADRGAFIDQSQSLNLHLAAPTFAKCSSMHFHAWKLGLKTGIYYLRTRPAVDAVQFTVDKLALREQTTPGNQDSGRKNAANLPQKENVRP